MAVLKGDARRLDLPKESVACIVTSPPYNTDQPYEGYVDKITWAAYGALAGQAAKEMFRVLQPGGRAWVNVMPSVPTGGRHDRTPLGHLWLESLLFAGFQYRDTVTWIQDSFDAACGWGSWRRPSAPNLRGGYEIVLSVFKDHWKRDAPYGREGYNDDYSTPELGEHTPWQDLVRNVWKIAPARRKGASPAPFPPELVERCIRLSTWPGEVVLDPFAGGGTTVDVAEQLGRVGLGFDVGAA